MKLFKTIYKHLLLMAIALASFTSCSMMTEDEPDCNPYYKVKFRFDMNLLYADAFSTQVGEVDLFVYDTEGKLVWQGHEEGDVLKEQDYMMDLPVPPGKYDLIAWCRKRHDDAADFNMSKTSGISAKEDVQMKMERQYEGKTAHSTTDLHALFHGKLDNVELPDTWGTHVVTVPLVKDTNSIRIMLGHLSGKVIHKEDFDFKITDNNGFLHHDNSFLDDEMIEYRPWSAREGLAQTVPPAVSDAQRPGVEPLTRATQTSVHSLVAEMTTSRLQTSQNPVLTVTRKSDGEKIIEIPVIDYFMMVKGEYNRKMEDDEYLDRQDDYSMTFFLHEDGTWYKSVVDILAWRVVLQGADL